MKKKIVWLLVSGLMVVALVLASCGPAKQEPALTDDAAQLMVAARLVDMAQTPEAKEYIGLLFPPVDWVERHENLEAWKYIVDRWPSEARSGFENAKWFAGDFDKHFSLFNRPTWVIYDNGKIVPQGGALFVEADIDKLNTKRTLE